MLGRNFETPNVIDAGDLPPSRPSRKSKQQHDDDDDSDVESVTNRPWRTDRILKSIPTNRSVTSTSTASTTSSLQRFRGTKISLENDNDNDDDDDTNKENLPNNNNNNTSVDKNSVDKEDDETVEVIDEYYDDEAQLLIDQTSQQSVLQHSRNSDARLLAMSILSNIEKYDSKKNLHDSSQRNFHETMTQPKTATKPKADDQDTVKGSDLMSSSISESISTFVTRTRNVHYWRKRNAKRRSFLLRSLVQVLILVLCLMLIIMVYHDNYSNTTDDDKNHSSSTNVEKAISTLGAFTIMLLFIATFMEWKQCQKVQREMEDAASIHKPKDRFTMQDDEDDDFPQPRRFESSTTLTTYPILVGDGAMPRQQSRHDDIYLEISQRDEDGNQFVSVEL